MSSARSAIAVRMPAKNAILGVLYVDNKHATGLYSVEDGKCLETLARVAALALLYLMTRRALRGVLRRVREDITAQADALRDAREGVNEHLARLQELTDPTRDGDHGLRLAQVRVACAELDGIVNQPADELDDNPHTIRGVNAT